jgi:hypothetical protein
MAKSPDPIARNQPGEISVPKAASLQKIEGTLSGVIFDPYTLNDENAWAQIAREHFTDNFDIAKLSKDARVIILGDTNHFSSGIQKGLCELIPKLKEAGVTHLALEIPSDRDPANIIDSVKDLRMPHAYELIIKKANTHDIKVVFVDMPVSEMENIIGSERQAFLRGVHMGKKVAGIALEDKAAKIAQVIGQGHTSDYLQVCKQLDDNGLKHLNLTCTVVGQPVLSPIMDFMFLELPVVTGIRVSRNEPLISGFLDLSGMQATSDGIIVFPRPKPAALEAAVKNRNLPLLPGEEIKSSLLPVPIKSTSLTSPAYKSYAHPDLVAKECRDWESTNQEKIRDFVSGLVLDRQVSKGEGIYLASLLTAYSLNTGEHSLSGSIVDMSYVPDARFFELTVVDLFGYKFNPAADYGARLRHHQVGIRALEERYGYLAGLDITPAELSKVSVKNNPESPHSVVNFAPYILTGLRKPERLQVWGNSMENDYQLRVYSEDKPRSSTPYIAALKLSDFELSPLEKHFMALKERLKTLNESLHSVRWARAVIELDNKPKGWRKLFQPKPPKELKSISEYDFLTTNSFNPEISILFARKDLTFLPSESAEKLNKDLSNLLDKFKIFHSDLSKLVKSKELGERTSVRAWSPPKGAVKYTLDHFLKEAEEIITELQLSLSSAPPSLT